LIDEEVRKIVADAYVRTIQLLTDKKEEVEKLAKALLDKEVLHQSDVEALIGKRPFEEKKILDVEPSADDALSANDKHHIGSEAEKASAAEAANNTEENNG
jgi:cell division protease FtsH